MPYTTVWLEFSVFSDGLDAVTARRMSRHHASFAPFPSLPAELRLRVWEYMLAPRIVQVRCAQSSDLPPSLPRERRIGRKGGAQGEQQQQQVPVLLHVNRETRALALSHYELAFGWRAPGIYYYPQSHYYIHETFPPPSPPPTSSPTHTSSPPRRPPMIETSSEPRTYFSFAQDALYLRGELKPLDSFGLSNPGAFFVSRADAVRARRVVIEFDALVQGPQTIFGSLFHIVDRFGAAGRGWKRGVGREGEGGGLDGDGKGESKAAVAGGSGFAGNTILVAVTAVNEAAAVLPGGKRPLIRDEDRGGKRDDEEVWRRDNGGSGEQAGGDGDVTRKDGEGREEEPNCIQKVWRDWYRGSTLAGVRFKLVREEDLERYL
ncbi:hypothetical protein DL768_002712 [Monosporascus sp. mg162]|nr:hypothetical protein DL768_002712 [Monosporascus sp. mg162]